MKPFDYFVVFAEMRTGSNFLEANLNALDGVTCHGEAFNPHFIGYPNRTELLGYTQQTREADPAGLIEAVKAAPGLNGFRFFNDHDPRALEIALPDPRCGKIVLTRNPAESYVSWKIAQSTGQWKLTNVKHARSDTVTFDAGEFEAHLEALQAFQVRLLKGLQTTGQTAFYVAYEDLQDVGVMNGLAAWLGVEGRLEALDTKLKRQNPEPMEEKVTNFPEMEASLARLDRFNLSRTPNFEPRRGAAVPAYVTAPVAPLMFMPVFGGPTRATRAWLAALDGAQPDALPGDFTPKTLRQWMRDHPGHRAFTVIRHPLARAHATFCEKLMTGGPGSYKEIRKTLRQVFKVDLPGQSLDDGYDAAAHREAFTGFLRFLKANLAGQTSVRVDPWWAQQVEVVKGMTGFTLPDMILREDAMATGCAQLAAQIGRDAAPPPPAETDPHAARLAEIHDDEIEAMAAEIYQRDYLAFGFGPWR